MGTISPADGRISFLSLVPEGRRRAALEGATTVRVPSGSIFYHPGDGDRVFIVNQGLIRAFFTAHDGRQATGAFAHTGQALGVGPLLGFNPNFAAQALVESEIVSPNTSRLQALARSDIEVCMGVARYLAHRLSEALHLAVLRALGDMRQRLAYDLLERACDKLAETRRLEVHASHHELALSVGTSREVISRTVAALRAENLIATSPGYIRITDADGLVHVISEFVSPPTL